MINDPLLPASSPNSETRVRGETNGHAERERAEILQAGVLKYNTRRRRENRARWYGYHTDQAERHRRTLEELIRYHEQKAEQLRTDEPKGAA